MVRLLLKFSEELVGQPITAEIILEHKVPINIITAHVDSKGGEVLAEVPDEALETVVKAFRQRGATVTLPKLVEVDKEKCFDCGACVSLCPVEAITVAEDCSVNFNKEKCVGSTCSACVEACPAGAIKSVKQNTAELANNTH
jgi:NAD-dependent dihydropyrimidine dehydrogenase PreA subunit